MSAKASIPRIKEISMGNEHREKGARYSHGILTSVRSKEHMTGRPHGSYTISFVLVGRHSDAGGHFW